jgi:hypothetical protein
MARLFQACPQALAATRDLFGCIAFTLNDLRYEYPHEPVPQGWEPQAWLEHLVHEAAMRKFPDGLPEAYRRTLDEEFRLIRERAYAYYFLTVHDVVRHARSPIRRSCARRQRGQFAGLLSAGRRRSIRCRKAAVLALPVREPQRTARHRRRFRTRAARGSDPVHLRRATAATAPASPPR